MNLIIRRAIDVECREMPIEEAKKLLTTGNLRIYEIAESLGFENAFYFSKVFKKAEGVSPREYQNRKFTDGTD